MSPNVAELRESRANGAGAGAVNCAYPFDSNGFGLVVSPQDGFLIRGLNLQPEFYERVRAIVNALTERTKNVK